MTKKQTKNQQCSLLRFKSKLKKSRRTNHLNSSTNTLVCLAEEKQHLSCCQCEQLLDSQRTTKRLMLLRKTSNIGSVDKSTTLISVDCMCRGMYVCECAYGEEKHSCREKCLERFCVLYSGRIQIDILTQTVQ